MSNQHQPTPEQVALAEQRKLKKEQNRLKAQEAEQAKSRILPREWLDFRDSANAVSGSSTVKVMSWNLLAQTLIRRELFPTSDCLKAAQRGPMINKEILSHNADICCLQEVDRTERLFPVLEEAGYGLHYATGPRKRHGCLIAYRNTHFSQFDEKKVVYDLQEVRDEGSERARRGSSFGTRNIAAIVALKRLDAEDDGIIVATTHLFWHPAYTYERSRQAAILLREVVGFRKSIGKLHWPCVIAGDFNFHPGDAAYSMIFGDPLLPAQSARLDSSKVVHTSVDPDVPAANPSMTVDEEEAGESDPDRVITNARAAIESDGLLTDDELLKAFKQYGPPISAYDQGLRKNTNPSIRSVTYGSVHDIPPDRKGGFEPAYTTYTHYWKIVVDYIFVLDPPDRQVTVLGLAKPHAAESLDPGLPQSGKCGSDHTSLCAELSWSKL